MIQFNNIIREKFLVVIVLFVLVIASSWSLFHADMISGHDGNHQARLFEMARGLKEGNFPVIWSQNLLFGYGMPLYEFYAPLPYYFGALFYLVSTNFTYSIYMLIIIANILTVIGSYYLGKTLFESIWAGLMTSTLITLAPYRSVDTYVRFAISELWAIMFVVWILLGTVMTIRKDKSGFIILILSISGLVLSHNLTAYFALPFIISFAVLYAVFFNGLNSATFRSVLILLVSGICAIGITSFYTLPTILEKDYTQVETHTTSHTYNYQQHFLYFRQLVKPWGEWEWGGSGWGPDDEMSFFLGYPVLLVVILSVVVIGYHAFLQPNKLMTYHKLAFSIFILIMFLISVFLTLTKASKIWDVIPLVSYIQFPWRLLSVNLVFAGLLGGSVIWFFTKKIQVVLLFLILGLSLIINAYYFRPERYIDYSSEYPNYAATVRTVRSENLFDYMPKDINFFEKQGYFIQKNPQYSHIDVPVKSVIQSKFENEYFPIVELDTSTEKRFSVTLSEPTNVTLNLAYYPGWEVAINGKTQDLWPNENGLVSFQLEQGKQHVRVTLEDTPIRFWSKVISLGTIILLMLVIIGVNFRGEFNKFRLYLVRKARL